MADDDEMIDDEPTADLEEVDEDADEAVEPDPEELEAADEEFVDDDDDDAELAVDEEEEEDDDEDEDDAAAARTRTKRASGEEEDDEDEELLSPDDVEADLDRILKDRMVTAEDEEDDEDEGDEPDDRSDPGERLQPKRADEQLCPSCFLLVRANAPGCPVGDDDCPIFS